MALLSLAKESRGSRDGGRYFDTLMGSDNELQTPSQGAGAGAGSSVERVDKNLVSVSREMQVPGKIRIISFLLFVVGEG